MAALPPGATSVSRWIVLLSVGWCLSCAQQRPSLIKDLDALCRYTKEEVARGSETAAAKALERVLEKPTSPRFKELSVMLTGTDRRSRYPAIKQQVAEAHKQWSCPAIRRHYDLPASVPSNTVSVKFWGGAIAVEETVFEHRRTQPGRPVLKQVVREVNRARSQLASKHLLLHGDEQTPASDLVDVLEALAAPAVTSLISAGEEIYAVSALQAASPPSVARVRLGKHGLRLEAGKMNVEVDWDNAWQVDDPSCEQRMQFMMAEKPAAVVLTVGRGVVPWAALANVLSFLLRPYSGDSNLIPDDDDCSFDAYFFEKVYLRVAGERPSPARQRR